MSAANPRDPRGPKKKLIEVALPLDAINRAASTEKSIRHGHPSTMHLWWARRPLAAARAMLFSQLVDDPSEHPELFPSERAQSEERERLFALLEELVRWESAGNSRVLAAARQEIRRWTGDTSPVVLDPFAGGGSIPLEAQRLGLTAWAQDLNPVAVLLNKAMMEIPPRFESRSAVNPAARAAHLGEAWQGFRGLAADVRHYAEWMRAHAWETLGSLYPPADLAEDAGSGTTPVIAWIWARTVPCPNPACGVNMPLVRSFKLSTKTHATAVPGFAVGEKDATFKVAVNDGEAPPATIGRQGATCIACKQAVPLSYVRTEAKAGRMGAQLMAIVGEGKRGRRYLSPTPLHVDRARQARPEWKPEGEMPTNPRWFSPPGFGLARYSDLFTPRQLTALTTFSDLILQARSQVLADARAAGWGDDGRTLDQGGDGAAAYADAVATYLALGVDRLADYHSTITTWNSGRDNIAHTFGRQAIPMTWDYSEANPFSNSTGNWIGAVDWIAEVLEALPGGKAGIVRQADATRPIPGLERAVVSTDPPYYDNIGYADLADFFYVWLRRSLEPVFPGLFRTVMTPKADELVATPYRFDGSRANAQAHFESGFRAAFDQLATLQDPQYPMTVYYAYKQQEAEAGESGGVASTGWETMLTGLVEAGFSVTGTWPVRSERSGRPVAQGTNALASSIVLVCRPRPADAPLATRRDFVTALKVELPAALQAMQKGHVAPVDMAQAAIGPGMAIYTRYQRVLEANGDPLPIRTALSLINQALDAYFEDQDGELDPESRWAVAWFEQYGFEAAPYGAADVMARAKNTSVDALVRAGVVHSQAGEVRLGAGAAPADGADEDWARVPAWRSVHQLARVVKDKGGAGALAPLLPKLGARADSVRELAYRLFALSDRKGWADRAYEYNTLVATWPMALAQTPSPQQTHLALESDGGDDDGGQ